MVVLGQPGEGCRASSLRTCSGEVLYIIYILGSDCENVLPGSVVVRGGVMVTAARLSARSFLNLQSSFEKFRET